jgi:hypothetical protein
MKFKTEFPNFKLDVPIPVGFVDNSWHNNAMPCWFRKLSDDQMVVLWIDYADPALRDHPQNARFVLHVMDSTLTEINDSFISNDYDDILHKLNQIFTNDRSEYISIVMSRELLRFCRENDLPFESADDLINRDNLTDFQCGWLAAYSHLWEGLFE